MTDMLFSNRLLWIGLLSVGLLGVAIGIATTAQAGSQLFEGSWTIKAFGNECAKGAAGQPYCVQPPNKRSGFSEFYSATGIPLGILCNPSQPRCDFQSTPTNGTGKFAPLGGSIWQALYCTPWNTAKWGSKTARPAKGGTAVYTNGQPIPPLYRNYAFFAKTTPNAGPDTYSCLGQSTDGFGGKGLVQEGVPVTGLWSAVTTGTQLGGFSFNSAPTPPPAGILEGVRATGLIGEVGAIYPYVYSYTYATFRNDEGIFGPGDGPGDFTLIYQAFARVVVKEGAAKFGGTMRMLGALTTKVCYYRQGGCSIGENNWRYDAVGATGYTMSGVVTQGYFATYKAYYYHTVLMQLSTVSVEGARFPWTTGSVTLTAIGRGPHKTIHYEQGFDNRNTATPSGKGTIKLVSPVLTRWLQPALKFETGGIGILRIKFVPEPQTWAMLVAGVALLGVGFRMRGR
jgi:hypothetical protein